MNPRILLSGGDNISNYVQAVEGCGGIPFGGYLPEVSTEYDGLILCGGGDIANYIKWFLQGDAQWTAIC